MLRIVRGQWMTATITGLLVFLVGFSVTELLQTPTYWRVITAALALAFALAIAFIADRREARLMASKFENDNPQSAGIYFEGGHGNRASNNTIIGYQRGIVAKNETDFQAEGNDVRLPREDDK